MVLAVPGGGSAEALSVDQATRPDLHLNLIYLVASTKK